MPKKLIVIKNVDKDKGNWVEQWKDKNKIGRFPHPFRLLALGGVGRGKTNTLKNVFLEHQRGKNRKFKRLYVLTCDIDSKEWVDCEPDGIFDYLPDIDLFNPKEKTMLIIDDFEWEKQKKEELKKLSTIMRYISSHKNVSVMLSYQSFFDCPSIARKCANVFVIYKPNSKQELTTIANRVGLNGDYLKHLFRTTARGRYDSITIDHTIDSPARIRKNIFEVLKSQSDSDSSDSDEE